MLEGEKGARRFGDLNNSQRGDEQHVKETKNHRQGRSCDIHQSERREGESSGAGITEHTPCLCPAKGEKQPSNNHDNAV